MRTVTSLMTIEALTFLYFTFFHTIMSYEIIFCENATNSKKNIRIMAGVKRTVYSMELFKKCHIVLLASIFLLSLLLPIVDNMNKS
jgi:hypothetical protein